MKVKGLMMIGWSVLSLGVTGVGAQDALPTELKALMDAYNTGVKQMEVAQTDKAMASFEAVMKSASASKEEQAKVVLAGAANNLGMILLGQKKVEEAEAMFRKAVAVVPEHALAINNLGTALRRQGKIKEACAEYERSVKADPELGLAANNLARLLFEAGEDKKAAELLANNLQASLSARRETLLLSAYAFERLKATQEKLDAVWDELFSATDKSLAARDRLLADLVLNGADGLALRKTEEGLAADPTWTAGHVFKARLTAKSGDTLSALSQFRLLVKSNPKDVSLRTDLLALLLEKRLFDEAKGQVEDALKAFPENSALWFAQGRVLEALGKDRDAEVSYFTATKFDAANINAWNNLALLAEKRNDEKTAVACYGKALKAQPRNARTLYNLGRLYVTKNIDVKMGVSMLDAAVSVGGEGAAEAKKLLDALAGTAKKTN